ncbi:MAG: DNA (cytosine-5-)-methyltransferase [Clostridia bacterium]|nr:DNA (cytosine-5-)-methyltransferase [Clostridia bacterium]
MITVASLFSGIGGIDLGFQQAGCEIVWANEFDKDAAITYRQNFSNTPLIEGDIRKVKAESIPDFDILVAGFPCQPFSIVGKQRGFDDPRGNLFFEIARILDKKRPAVVFLENVQNLIEHDKGKTFLVIYNALVQFGYYVNYKVLDSQFYGNIPQQRKRIYIVGFLDCSMSDNFRFPDEIPLTMQLNDVIDRSVCHDKIYYYNASSFWYEDLVRTVIDSKALYKINDYGVSAKKHFVCPTLMANMGTYPDRIPVLKDDFGIRKLTPRECLALQGFPSEFTFNGISLNNAYKQCGNSVTVPVIRRIADAILKVLR